MADPTPSVQPYDHEVANVNLRAEIVAMHRVIESQRHRISQAEALAETLREDLADAEKPLAALRAEVERLRDCAGELLDVADLRGDSALPHPADDPILWTARMQTAWDEMRAALEVSRG